MWAKQLHIFRIVTKCSYHSFKYPNEKKRKNIKKICHRAVFRTLSNIYDGAFLRKYNCWMFLSKRFIFDVWYGSKYTPEVVQDSIINLKWISSKMLQKTVHFLNVNVNLAEGTLRRNIPRHQKQQFVNTQLNSRS